MHTNLIIFKINEAAKNWERTKEQKYKDEWYQLIKEFKVVKNQKNNRQITHVVR